MRIRSSLDICHRYIAAPLVALVRKARQSEFTHKFVEMLGGQFVVSVAAMVSGILLARMLGPEGRGQVAVATAIGVIGVQVGGLGLPVANTYFVAKDRLHLPFLLGNALLVSWVGIGGFVLALWWILSFVPEAFPLQGLFLPLVLLGIPIVFTSQIANNLLLGLQEVRTYNFVVVSVGVISLIAVAGLAWLRISVPEYFYFISIAVPGLASIFALSYLFKKSKRRPGLSMPLLNKCYTYGWKSFACTSFALLIQRVDQLMVERYLGYEATGHYSIAVGIISMLHLFPAAAGQIAFPRMVSMSSFEERMLFAWRATAMVSVFLIIPVMSVVFLGKTVVVLLYGEAFAPAAGPLFWFMPGFILWSLEVMFRRVLVSDGFPVAIVFGWLCAFLCNIVLNILFIPKYGLNGAAFASSMSFMVVAFATLFIFIRLNK